MRLTILALVLLAAPAYAESPDAAGSEWFSFHTGTGVAGTADQDSAAAGGMYITTIDATGESEPILVIGCDSWTLVGQTVLTNFVPVQCESALCTYEIPCNSGTTCVVNEGCHEDGTSVAALKVTAATSGDVILLTCGK